MRPLRFTVFPRQEVAAVTLAGLKGGRIIRLMIVVREIIQKQEAVGFLDFQPEEKNADADG